MFPVTVFHILLFKGKLVLRYAQRVPGSESANTVNLIISQSKSGKKRYFLLFTFYKLNFFDTFPRNNFFPFKKFTVLLFLPLLSPFWHPSPFYRFFCISYTWPIQVKFYPPPNKWKEETKQTNLKLSLITYFLQFLNS